MQENLSRFHQQIRAFHPLAGLIPIVELSGTLPLALASRTLLDVPRIAGLNARLMRNALLSRPAKMKDAWIRALVHVAPIQIAQLFPIGPFALVE